ncbi:CBS domain-containing protein [bacterium]|nr:CBS domain-containing protein [bacterium]
MDELNLHIASTLGILLGVSLLAGTLAEYLRLPKVTAFLLVGMVLGPSVLEWIPEEHVHSFDTMLKLAMALVLFGLGCQFPVRRILQIVPRAIALSVGELTGTLIIVTLGLWLFGVGGRQSLLLGCLALATAPATTILVLKELRSDGPVTDLAGILVALNNLAAILVFDIVFLAMQWLDSEHSGELPTQIRELGLSFGGAVLAGFVGGLVVSYGCGMMHRRRWLALLVASTTFVLGLCESLTLPYMLTFLVMGFTVANSSDVVNQIAEELNQLGGLLSVLFFAVHGAELDLDAFVAAGLIGGAYIVFRSLGKIAGIYAAARLTGQSHEIRNWLGPAMLAQAGAAIALANIAVARAPEIGRPIQAIILGSVVVFEIIGPLLIRHAMLKSGEVPIASAIHHTESTPLEEAHEVWHYVRASVGWAFGAKATASDLAIEPLVRRGMRGIRQSANFSEVLDYIEHSHEETYPVVNAENAVVGLIRYPLLSNVMFDPSVTELVCAEDLATPVEAVIYQDETVTRAAELFKRIQDDCLPVVEREEPHALIGIIRRSDVMRVLIRRHGRAS